jgi:hypothetical protein
MTDRRTFWFSLSIELDDELRGELDPGGLVGRNILPIVCVDCIGGLIVIEGDASFSGSV